MEHQNLFQFCAAVCMSGSPWNWHTSTPSQTPKAAMPKSPASDAHPCRIHNRPLSWFWFWVHTSQGLQVLGCVEKSCGLCTRNNTRQAKIQLKTDKFHLQPNSYFLSVVSVRNARWDPPPSLPPVPPVNGTWALQSACISIIWAWCWHSKRWHLSQGHARHNAVKHARFWLFSFVPFSPCSPKNLLPCARVSSHQG